MTIGFFAYRHVYARNYLCYLYVNCVYYVYLLADTQASRGSLKSPVQYDIIGNEDLFHITY